MNDNNNSYLIQEKNIQLKNCEEALSYIYNDGKFQKIAMLLLTICYTCTGAFITNSLIFMLKDPKIECYYKNNSFYQDMKKRNMSIKIKNDLSSELKEFNFQIYEELNNITKKSCLRKEACDKFNENLVNYKFLYESHKYYSWVNDFKMGCEENYIIGLFSSIFFVGGLISSLISTSLSDFFGRAKLIKISMIIRSFFLLFIILFPNEKTILISMFLLGLLNSMHSNIPYILLSEYMKRENRDDYLTYMFIFESFSGILGTFFFLIIQNWILFLVFYLIYGLIFIFYSDYLYESPRYLFSKGLFVETREVLKEISQFNLGFSVNITFENELKKDKEIINQDLKKRIDFLSECLEIFKSTKYRLYIIVMPLIWFLDAFAFFAIYFMIKYFDNNLYLMNIILFISEAVSYNFSNYFAKIYGKRDCMIYSFLISAISFIMFYIFSSSSIITLFLIFSVKFGAAVVLNISSIYTNECFPTSIRGRSTAICSFLGKFGGILSPIFVEMTKSTSLTSSFFCFFAAGILIPLKNSNNKIAFEDDDFEKLKEHKDDIKEDTKINFLEKYNNSDFNNSNLQKASNVNGRIKSKNLLEIIQKDKENNRFGASNIREEIKKNEIFNRKKENENCKNTQNNNTLKMI